MGTPENTKWRKCFLSIRDETGGQFSREARKTGQNPTMWEVFLLCIIATRMQSTNYRTALKMTVDV